MLAAVMPQVPSTRGQGQELVPAAATGRRGADIAIECAPPITGRFPLGEVARARAASEHPKIVLDVTRRWPT